MVRGAAPYTNSSLAEATLPERLNTQFVI